MRILMQAARWRLLFDPRLHLKGLKCKCLLVLFALNIALNTELVNAWNNNSRVRIGPFFLLLDWGYHGHCSCP